MSCSQFFDRRRVAPYRTLDPQVAAPAVKANTIMMLKEFKEFALKGNVVDMAVGIIIGGAFGKIVT